jgi:hypothetical protein
MADARTWASEVTFDHLETLHESIRDLVNRVDALEVQTTKLVDNGLTEPYVASDTDSIDIDPDDLSIVTYRASSSAWIDTPAVGVRITYLPTGFTVSEDRQKSAHRNKAVAMDEIILHVANHRKDSEARSSNNKIVVYPNLDEEAFLLNHLMPLKAALDRQIKQYDPDCVPKKLGMLKFYIESVQNMVREGK